MGMLDQVLDDGSGGGDGGAIADGIDSAAGEAADLTPVVPEPEKKERVSLPPRRSPGHRREALEAVEKVKAFEETLAKEREEWRKELSTRDQELARLRGGFEALQPILQQRQQPQAAAAPPIDPEALRREARAALDASRFDDYERLTAQATRYEAKQEVLKDLEERGYFANGRQQAGPQIDPRLQIIMNQHPKVMLDPAGPQIAIAEDMKLAAHGQANGPARWKRAYEMAEAEIAGREPAPREFSQQGAGAMAGIPTGRNSAGGGGQRGPGVELSELEKSWATRAGMSYSEYAEEIARAHPERVV